MRPRNSKECKEVLEFLDFFRKSKCTPTHSVYKNGPEPRNSTACEKVLDNMAMVTEECIEIKKNEITQTIKREEKSPAVLTLKP